jgi:ABC-type amino acid transport system permease subunit
VREGAGGAAYARGDSCVHREEAVKSVWWQLLFCVCVVFVTMWVIECQGEDCARRRCKTGSPTLTRSGCFCLERPVAP